MPLRAATVPGPEPNLKVGTILVRSCTCDTPVSRRVAAPNAWIEIGTLCTFSARFWAVTMMSVSDVGASADAVSVAGGLGDAAGVVCACA